MAKGFDKHQARQDALGRLGRPLARRSGSRCELCETAGVSLRTLEVPPLPPEPELERCLFACDPCHDEITSGKIADPRRWRCLEQTAWSEEAAVQVTAVRILRILDQAGERWATDLLESLYLPPEVEEWVDAS